MASNANRYKIPHRINDPLLILFIFTVEQVVPVVIALFLGMMSHQTVPALATSIIYIYGTGRLKKKYTRGYLKHRAWWMGFLPFKISKSFPDPFKREYYR
jgi:type IV conjugative transfer system protein TraL